MIGDPNRVSIRSVAKDTDIPERTINRYLKGTGFSERRSVIYKSFEKLYMISKYGIAQEQS